MSKKYSPYLEAIRHDNSLEIEEEAVKLWLKDLDNPFRWVLRPVLQFVFAILLHLIWFFKRLPLPQFSAHESLQKLICWFCTHFVSPEANLLILRHFATESNILNFLAANSGKTVDSPVALYPKSIHDMLTDSFVKHDQELFRLFSEIGRWQHKTERTSQKDISWQNWQPVQMDDFQITPRKTQVLDFESAHSLFMCLFCLLLTREEYRDAINGFNLDQSIALRISQVINEPSLPEMAYNKFPHYLVGPWNLSQRFLMHGFFTEYLYATLESLRKEQG